MLPQRIQTRWSVSIPAPTSGPRKRLCQRGDTALEWQWWVGRSMCVGEKRAGTGKLIRKELTLKLVYRASIVDNLKFCVSNKMFIGTVF